MLTAARGSARNRSAALGQRTAGNILHREVGHAFPIARLVDRDDVRMFEPGQRLRLDRETLCDSLIQRSVAEQHLQRDGAVQAVVLGLKDPAHPAATENRENGVVADYARSVGFSDGRLLERGRERVNVG